MIFDFKFTFDSEIAIPTIKVDATYQAAPTVLFDAKLYFKITSPLGVVIKDYGSAADLTFLSALGPGGSQSFNLVGIPGAVNGELLNGTYTVKIKQINSGDLSVEEQEVAYYYCNPNYCDDGIIGALKIITDCTNAILELSDITDIKDYTLSTRVLTLDTPALPGSIASKQTTAQELISAPLTYENVTYSGSLLLTIFKETTIDSVVFKDLTTVQDTIEEKILCGAAGCEIVSCAKELITKITNEACKVSGYSNLSKADQDLGTVLSMWLGVYDSSLKCYDQAGVDLSIIKLESITRGRCSNLTTPSTDPIPINSGGTGVDFTNTTNQTDWVYVDESELSNAQYDQLLGSPVDKIRYRKLMTKHLEIQGSFIYKPDGSSVALQTPILKNFFSGELADSDYDQDRNFIKVVVSKNNGNTLGFMRYQKFTSDNNFSLVFGDTNANDGDLISFHVMIPLS